MTTMVLTSGAAAAAAYDDEGYSGDTEWSPVLEKEISNLVTFDPLIINNNAQCESSQEEEEEEDNDNFDFFHSFYLKAAQFESELQLEQEEEEDEEEEKEVSDLFYKFDPITITAQGHWLKISDVGITDRITFSDDKLRQTLMDAFNFVNSDHDHADDHFYNILSDEQYASLGDIDSYNISFSGFPIVIRDTFDRSQLDFALGRSWIMDDSIRVLRRVCREIKDHDAFVEFLNNHVTEVRRVNQEISQNDIPGGGDDHSFLRTNKYEIMLHAAVRIHLETLRADGELKLVDGEWTNELAVLFFLVLEEINNLVLDPNTELEILLELIYAEIE